MSTNNKTQKPSPRCISILINKNKLSSIFKHAYFSRYPTLRLCISNDFL